MQLAAEHTHEQRCLAGCTKIRKSTGAFAQALYVEAISNPTLVVADLPRLAQIAHGHVSVRAVHDQLIADASPCSSYIRHLATCVLPDGHGCVSGWQFSRQ